jgi:hypothetical protein
MTVLRPDHARPHGPQGDGWHTTMETQAMTQTIAQRAESVRPDIAQGKHGLQVVPILGRSLNQPEYRLLDGHTLAAVRITETSDAGSVPALRIENALDSRVFLMDGQELVGAKQNRILNTDVLVPASTTLTLPVSCVEAGRWAYSSPSFTPGKTASHRVRSGKQDRVYASLRKSGHYDADQSAVWDEVHATLMGTSCMSSTSALHDAYRAQEAQLVEFRSLLRLPEHAVGLAVFCNSRFQGLDLFDRCSTFHYFWESLVDSYAIDWLAGSAGKLDSTVDPAQVVSAVLHTSGFGNWEAFSSPGEGRDYRLSDGKLSGSALVWEEKVVVHLQVFPKPDDQEQERTSAWRPRIHRRYARGG